MPIVPSSADATASLAAVAAAIGAIGGLGAAASGLVDATKVLGGGISLIGFDKIERVLNDYSATEALDQLQPGWRDAVRARWINGVAKEDQKTAVRSLIRLGMDVTNAAALAKKDNVDPAAFQGVVEAIIKGETLSPERMALLGRFNDELGAKLDGAFELADQQYRNVSKAAAGVVAIVLSVWAGGLLAGATTLQGFLTYSDIGKALLIGVIAVPLAPVAKDLTSSIQAAANAMKTR